MKTASPIAQGNCGYFMGLLVKNLSEEPTSSLQIPFLNKSEDAITDGMFKLG